MNKPFMASHITYKLGEALHMKWNILGSSKLSARFQITLPDDVRKKLKVEEGEQILFSEEEGKIVLRNSKLEA